MSKFCSAAEAVSDIRSGQTIASVGVIGWITPDALLKALADRFDDPVGVLRDRGRVAGQHGPAAISASVPSLLRRGRRVLCVRPVNLDHRDLAVAPVAPAAA